MGNHCNNLQQKLEVGSITERQINSLWDAYGGDHSIHKVSVKDCGIDYLSYFKIPGRDKLIGPLLKNKGSYMSYKEFKQFLNRLCELVEMKIQKEKFKAVSEDFNTWTIIQPKLEEYEVIIDFPQQNQKINRFDNIPKELAIKILSYFRSDIGSLLTVRSVCKEWFSTLRKIVQDLHLIGYSSDKKLRILRKVFPNLSILDASKCSFETEGCIEVISEFNNLQILNIHNPFSFEVDKELAHLCKLKNLQRLFINEIMLMSKGCEIISKITTLIILDISKTDISDDDLSYLSSLVNLRYLGIEDTPITIRGLNSINKLPLIYLNAYHCYKFSPDNVLEVKFPQLTHLAVGESEIEINNHKIHSQKFLMNSPEWNINKYLHLTGSIWNN